MKSITHTVGLLVLVASACGQVELRTSLEAELEFERISNDDLTTVRNLNGSLWGGQARFVEELTIGTLDGPDEYLFGSIAGITADGERIYLVDRQVPIVRVYDWDGNHIMDVGRQGNGPGEYRGPSCVVVDPVDGTLFVEDYRGPGRILSYDSGGTPLGLETFLTTRYSSGSLFMTTAGVLYMEARWRLPNDDPRDDMRRGMILWEPGVASRDTIPAPGFDFEPEMVWAMRDGRRSMGTNVPFWPDTSWEMIPSGAMVGGLSDQYRFEIHHPDGRRTVVQRYWNPIPIPDGHRAYQKTIAMGMLRQAEPGYQWNGPAIPSTKPAFIGFFGDHNGRIWVIRQGRSINLENCDETGEDYTRPCWEDVFILDAFEESGRYLGQVEVPKGIHPTRHGSFIQDEYMIARLTGEDGVPYVKRYRLELPGG